MLNIVPVSDLQRKAASILNEVNETEEPVIITQRGRASAVIVSAKHYARIEEDIERLDRLELEKMLAEARKEIEAGNTLTLEEVKTRLGYPG